MARRLAVLLVLVAAASVPVCAARAQDAPAGKKLIEYGWDVPTPAYLREHVREMEEQPFDGVIMYLSHEGSVFRDVFMLDRWDDARFAAVLEDLRAIKWGRFTDNFISVCSRSEMDWFSDADWRMVLRKVGMMARAAAGRCKGLCFDPEPYGDNPWSYGDTAHRDTKSFAQYQAQARRRGAQFMRAIAKEMPDAVLHTFFQLSYFANIASEPDPAQREQMLRGHYYGLLPAFLNGMLDAAGPEVIITDGNERSYYYTDPLQYYQAYHEIRQGALALIAPENVRKYQTQVQVSQALYVDQLFNLRRDQKLLSSLLTPEQRARWFEQNVYYALATADEYVWCHSEQMDWWKNRNIPPGLPEAIRVARRKIAEREPLGYDMSEELKDAEERLRAELESLLVRRSARIARRPAQVAAPVIDGRLDDPIWRETEPLEPFLRYVGMPPQQPAAATEVRVAYDDEMLYLAFRCEEPNPAGMILRGSERDDSVWMGDSVDIFLSVGEEPLPFVHFILNPDNVQWDARNREKDDHDTRYSPRWQSATAVGEGAWSAEVALPWVEIEVAVPRPGKARRAQLGRQRRGGGEQSTWSQVLSGFVAPEYFGTWRFD